jgi:HAE1 family hydrophobic/amphiphilic exporter-1
LSVSGKLLEGYDAGSVGGDIKDLIAEMDIPDGYMVEVSGEYDDIMDAFRSLFLSLLLGVVLIYMIMASQFESFKYPFIILFTIPLAFTGSFIGLFITGTTLSITSVLGFLVLSGVVVNNGIVLVDYINKLKDSGMGTTEAIMEAGPVRLRPILMTALTTILALLPSAIGYGEGAEMMRPLGISVIGGLIMSTFLTLLVVPSIYYIFDRKGRKAEQEVQQITEEI